MSLLQQNQDISGLYDVTLPDGSRLPVYLETTDDGNHWVVGMKYFELGWISQLVDVLQEAFLPCFINCISDPWDAASDRDDDG